MSLAESPMRTVLLASGSPRRRLMLERAGFRVLVREPRLDDATLPLEGTDPQRVTTALAWFKASQVLADSGARGARSEALWLVAADTLCVLDGALLGKPADRDAAERCLRRLAGRRHEVVTGACLIELASGRRRLFADRAVVTLGELDGAALTAHLDAERWRGRAGGYNWSEAVDAGWPLRCEGDPATVMGLPLRRILPVLEGGFDLAEHGS